MSDHKLKNERIVCLVVADAHGQHNTIDGQELMDRIRRTLDAYEFTESGIKSVMQVILGNEEVPLRDDTKPDWNTTEH